MPGVPVGKQDEIIRHVARSIRSGLYMPETQLPVRDEFERMFSTTRVTVQRAFDRLIAGGSVVSRGKEGTFVCPHPPQLTRYALAIPEESIELRFWDQLRYCAKKINAANEGKFHIDLFSNSPGESCRLLSGLAEEQMLAGIIFGTNPFQIANTPAVSEPGIPRVGFLSHQNPEHISEIHFVRHSFMQRGIERLAQLGRKSAGAILVPGLAKETDLCNWRALCTQAGLQTEDRWLHQCSQSDPRWARHIILALFAGPREYWPEGILVFDDNLVDFICSGLIEAGVRVPEDVVVIAHANFPLTSRPPLPFLRLGYDIMACLNLAIAMLREQMTGTDRTRFREAHPVFEEEIPAT